MQRSRSSDYEPPYPAYQSHFDSGRPDYVMAMVGVQSVETSSGMELSNRILHLFNRDHSSKPDHVERCIQSCDGFGYHNDVFIAYWTDKTDMSEFWERTDVRSWLEEPCDGDIGWWRECMVAPVSSLDGNASIGNIRYGVGRYVKQELEQFHAYFGSMRDRVVDYLSGAADGEEGRICDGQENESFGKRLRISNPPDKLCFIRGPFGWDKADTAQQQDFIDDMLPVFKRGADYLRDNPMDSNCVSMRFLQEVDMGLNNGVQVEVLGWFLTLKDLENWTHHHPTHKAIYRGVFEYMRKYNFEARLNMGHEVVVVPAEGVTLEYCNCHPKTGFLPFYASAPV